MKKFLSILLALCMCTVLFVGCSGNSSESKKNTSDSSAEPIKLAVYPLPSPYFEYAMESLELFTKNNANVELVEFAQYSDVIQALDSGSVDASIMGITEAVTPIANGLDLDIVLMTDYSAGMDGIVAAPGINSVKDLKGKTIATNIGTMNHMLLLTALEQAGLSESDVNITNMSEGDATAALVGGSIDAASIFDPQMSKAAKEGGGKVIFSSKDLPGELSDVLIIKDSIVKDRADEVQGIVDAWYQVQDKYNKDSDSVVDLISPKAELTNDEFYSLLDGIDIATKDYNKEVFANNGEKMTSLVTKVANFLKDADCIESVPSEDKIKASIVSTFVEAESK
nr:ABC transporter substrate-binding protein [uncultured Ruminococcus sp.]